MIKKIIFGFLVSILLTGCFSTPQPTTEYEIAADGAQYAAEQYSNSNFSESFNYSKKSASLGSTASQVWLAKHYFEGAGTEKNNEYALYWSLMSLVSADCLRKMYGPAMSEPLLAEAKHIFDSVRNSTSSAETIETYSKVNESLLGRKCIGARGSKLSDFDRVVFTDEQLLNIGIYPNSLDNVGSTRLYGDTIYKRIEYKKYRMIQVSKAFQVLAGAN